MALVGARPSLSLGGVAALPLERRCAFVQEAGVAVLEATMDRIREELPEVARMVSVTRMAWAVAFNVTGELAADGPAYRGKRTYLDYWHPETPWSQVWSSLGAPLVGDAEGGSRTGLFELATSVACEHRDDWQPRDARPVSADGAQAAFAVLYERHNKKVTGYVSAQFRRRAGDPQDIAMEAWSRVFLEYWSGAAHKRVLGTSAISSLVCGTAYYIGCDTLRRQKGQVVADEQYESPAGPRGRAAGAEPVANGPGDQLVTNELEQHVRLCRQALPARQQVAARMVWDHEMRQVEVARRLGVSAPAVSQLLEKARNGMHKCLKSKGLVKTRGPASPLRRSP